MSRTRGGQPERKAMAGQKDLAFCPPRRRMVGLLCLDPEGHPQPQVLLGALGLPPLPDPAGKWKDASGRRCFPGYLAPPAFTPWLGSPVPSPHKVVTTAVLVSFRGDIFKNQPVSRRGMWRRKQRVPGCRQPDQRTR